MRVINARAALLSDFEVLQLLRDLDAEQEAALRTPSASQPQSPSAEPSTSKLSHEEALAQIPSNLRTIQFELQAYLSNAQSPSAHQDADSVNRFLDELREWERGVDAGKRLTKGERLMILNHAPRQLIELYTMIEELPLRFTEEEQLSLLELVHRTLPAPLSDLEMEQQQQQEAAAADGTEDQSAGGANGLFFGDDTQAEIDYEAAENGAYDAEMQDAGGEEGEEEGLEFEGGAEGAVDDEVPDDD